MSEEALRRAVWRRAGKQAPKTSNICKKSHKENMKGSSFHLFSVIFFLPLTFQMMFEVLPLNFGKMLHFRFDGKLKIIVIMQLCCT